MTTLFRAIDLVPTSLNEEARSIDFLCSNERIDSYETKIKQNWNLERYAKNPTVLFAHNSWNLPIGRATNVRVTSEGLLATVVFGTQETGGELAETCWQSAKAGLLRGISVGFRPHSYRWEKIDDRELLVLDDNELLELSLTPLPSNPDALARTAGSPASAQAQLVAEHLASLDKLRALAREARDGAPPNPTPATPSENRTTMDIETLKAQLAAKTSEVAARDAEIAASKREIELTRTAKETAEKDVASAKTELTARDAKISQLEADKKTLTTEGERLGREVETHSKRAAELADKLDRQELSERLGKDVDPHEVDHLLELKRSAPKLYEAEMKRRTASGRDDGMTKRLIPEDGPENRAAGVNEADSYEAAMARQKIADD